MMFIWIIIVVLVFVAVWYFSRKGFSYPDKKEGTPLEPEDIAEAIYYALTNRTA